MISIPPKVHHLIADQLSKREDILNLLVTSRSFYSATLRVLYQDVMVYFTRGEDDLKKGLRGSSTDSIPVNHPLLRGQMELRLVREPGGDHVDIATFLYKLNIGLDANKIWIASVLEAAVNLKSLTLRREWRHYAESPNTRDLDENGLPFSALVGLKPRFRLHTFFTNLPGDEYMSAFLQGQSSITTLEWLPHPLYPFTSQLFRSPPLLPSLQTLICNLTTQLFLLQRGRMITHVQYVGHGFGEVVRTWKGKENVRALRIVNMSNVQQDQFPEEGVGFPKLEYLCADSDASRHPYMLEQIEDDPSLPSLRCFSFFTDLSDRRECSSLARGFFDSFATLDKVIIHGWSELWEVRRQKDTEVLNLVHTEHVDDWRTGAWDRDYTARSEEQWF